jgi:hypothetical protein
MVTALSLAVLVGPMLFGLGKSLMFRHRRFSRRAA